HALAPPEFRAAGERTRSDRRREPKESFRRGRRPGSPPGRSAARALPSAAAARAGAPRLPAAPAGRPAAAGELPSPLLRSKSSSPTAADAPGRPRAPTPPGSSRTSRFRAHRLPLLLWLCLRIHGPPVSDRRPPRPPSPRPAAGAVPKDAPRGPAAVAPGAGPIPAQPVAPRRAREPRTMPYHSGTRRTEQRRSRHRRGEAEAAERVPTHGPTRGDPRPPPGPAAGCRRAPGFRLAPRAGAAARPVPTTGGGADRGSPGRRGTG